MTPLLFAAYAALPYLWCHYKKVESMKKEAEAERRAAVTGMRGEELVNAFVALGAERDEFERKLKFAEAVNQQLREDKQVPPVPPAPLGSESQKNRPEFDLAAFQEAHEQVIEGWTNHCDILKDRISAFEIETTAKIKTPYSKFGASCKKFISEIRNYLRREEGRRQIFSENTKLLEEMTVSMQSLTRYQVGMHDLIGLARVELHLPILTPGVHPTYATDGAAIAEILRTWRAMRETAQQRLDELNAAKARHEATLGEMTREHGETIVAKALLQDANRKLMSELHPLRRLARHYLDEIVP